jgi:hypothetical protein
MYTKIQTYLKRKGSNISGFTEDKTRALCVCFRNVADVPPVHLPITVWHRQSESLELQCSLAPGAQPSHSAIMRNLPVWN